MRWINNIFYGCKHVDGKCVDCGRDEPGDIFYCIFCSKKMIRYCIAKMSWDPGHCGSTECRKKSKEAVMRNMALIVGTSGSG